MSERTSVDISTASVFRALLVLLAFVLLYLLSDVLVIMMFAIIVASAVSPFVSWLEVRGIPRLAGALILYLFVAAIVVVLSSLILPSLASELGAITDSLPNLASNISGSLETVQAGAPGYFDFLGEVQNILETLSGYLQQFSQSSLNLAIGAFGGLVTFVAVVVISFYLAVIKDGVQSFLQAVVPERYEEYVVGLWKRTEVKVGYWLQGQLLLALIVGLLVYVGLSLLGVKYALVLAIIAMVMELVPVAGPVLAAIPAIAVAFVQEPALAFWVFLLYVGIQQLENHVLTPLVMGKTVGLNPVVVIIAILVGSSLAGISGMIISIPVAVVIVEILDDMARVKSARKNG